MLTTIVFVFVLRTIYLSIANHFFRNARAIVAAKLAVIAWCNWKKGKKVIISMILSVGILQSYIFFFLVPYARKKGIRINFHLCIKTFFLFKSDVNGNQVFKTTLSGSQMTAFMRVIFKWLCIILQCFLMTEIETVYSSPIHYVL